MNASTSVDFSATLSSLDNHYINLKKIKRLTKFAEDLQRENNIKSGQELCNKIIKFVQQIDSDQPLEKRVQQLFIDVKNIKDEEENSIAHQIAITGDLIRLRAFESIGIDINTKNKKGNTPIEVFRMTSGLGASVAQNISPKLTTPDEFIAALKEINLVFNHKNSYDTGGTKVVYHFTNVFFSTDFHSGSVPMLVMLVGFEEKYYPRICYLSGTHAIWRTTDKVFLGDGYISKSVLDEDAVAIPFKIGRALMDIYKHQKKAMSLQKGVFKKIMPFITSVTERDSGISTDSTSLDGRDYAEIILCKYPLAEKAPLPEKLNFKKDEYEPDFVNGFDFKYEIPDSRHYGPMIAMAFFNKLKTIRYLFIEEIRNNLSTGVFIAGAEVSNSQITRHGLRKDFCRLGALSLTKIEYTEQCPEKFFTNSNKAHYTDTWQYLKQVDVIQRYYTDRGLVCPI